MNIRAFGFFIYSLRHSSSIEHFLEMLAQTVFPIRDIANWSVMSCILYLQRIGIGDLHVLCRISFIGSYIFFNGWLHQSRSWTPYWRETIQLFSHWIYPRCWIQRPDNIWGDIYWSGFQYVDLSFHCLIDNFRWRSHRIWKGIGNSPSMRKQI